MTDTMPDVIYTSCSEQTGRIYGHLDNSNKRTSYTRTELVAAKDAQIAELLGLLFQARKNLKRAPPSLFQAIDRLDKQHSQNARGE